MASALNHPALTLLSELLDIPAPSGREERLGERVSRKTADLGYVPVTDGAGNVVVRLSGRDSAAPLTVIAAHLDEIAMVVVGIGDEGALRVDRAGGLYPWKLGECPVDIVGDGEVVRGVLSYGSTHTKGAEPGGGQWSDWRVVTGLSREQLAAAGVRVGSTAVPFRAMRGPVLFGDPADPLVAAWTFDDRGGVVTLLRLLESIRDDAIEPEGDLIIAFTVHEEGGCHGAKVLADRERPEVFLAVDGCPIPPGSSLKLDGRPGTWSKDSVTHFDQRLVQALLRCARAAGTELQTAVYDAAASDASEVYASGGAPRVGTVGIVRENSHGYEVARLSVFDNLLKTLVRFVQKWRA